ncbi:MAG TPA: PliI family lysozyme inhibitor of I-type lysozyme [Rhodocyclaceae bacterium]
MNDNLKGASFLLVLLASMSASLHAEAPSRPFFAQQVLQGVTFQIESPNNSSINKVRVRAQVGKKTIGEHEVEADGAIIGVEVADLNADGFPEIYVYVTSTGSGSYGSLIAFASNRNRSITPITLASLEDEDAAVTKGYMGHDKFLVGEAALLRRFPIYREGDANSKPTGGMRQIQYRLKAGEAGWVLRKDRVVEF